MSEKRMDGGNQVLGNQYGLHLEDARHLQQSRDPDITAALDRETALCG
jgi:hypothetical protein